MSPQERPPSDRLSAALAVLDLCTRAAAAHDRPDLVTRLGEVQRRLLEPVVNTLVVGEFKKGKSMLVNGLLTADICPTDGALATAVPTVVRYGSELSATAVYAPPPGSDDENVEPRLVPIEFAEVEMLAVESDENGDTGLRGIEVLVPRPLLEQGLVLVDTPGVGGLMSRHGGATASTLANGEAVVFVTDAGQELTAAEADYLDRARRACPTLAVVLTKIDIYPQWRQILELDRRHLESLGIDAPIIPVSSAIRHEAIAAESRDLSTESGFPELVAWLRGVAADLEGTSIQRAVTDMADVAAQLARTVNAELEALLSPEATEQLLARLGEAEEGAKSLQRQSSEWQTALNDGTADLTANVDHDLRTRIRNLNTEAQEYLSKADPTKIWEEFERWLYQQSTAAILGNYELLRERTGELGRRVGDVFQAEEDTVVPEVDIEAPTAALDAIQTKATFDPQKTGRVETAFTALRGGQSGLLLFGIYGGVIGIAVSGPVVVVAGLFMAGKSIRQERKRQITARRQQAEASVRKYLDEISFHVGKESRQSLRTVQRALRDHYQQRAVELHTSAQRALQAARTAVQADEQQRRQRMQESQADLRLLDALAERVNAL